MDKERYFTLEAISSKAQEMLEALRPVRRPGTILDPKRAALLVLDMQQFFLDETSHSFIPSALPVLPRIGSVVEAWHTHRRPVLFTRHTNTPQDAGMMAVWWKDLLRPDSPGSAITPGVHPEDGLVIEKTQYDAFYRTQLEGILHDQEVKQVVITGVMTHLCCETTARAAFGRGFEVFFTVDGTATYTEAFHRATLLNLAHGFAVPVLVEEVVQSLENLEA
jgi:nicotinamidase-related amidase